MKQKELIRDTRSWDGKPLPAYPLTEPEIAVKQFIFEPGERLPMHSHPVINAGIVTRGHLTIVTEDGVEKTFGPGEPLIEIVGAPHYGENRGNEPVELIMFYAATTNVPLSISR